VQTGIRIYTGSGLRGVIPYVQFVLLMLFALVCSGAIQTDEKELGPKSLWCVCVGAKFGWRKKKKNGERAPSKWSEKKNNPPSCLRCLSFYQPREDLHVKAKRKRVRSLREYRESFYPCRGPRYPQK
jgi:hypothetical protein